MFDIKRELKPNCRAPQTASTSGDRVNDGLVIASLGHVEESCGRF